MADDRKIKAGMKTSGTKQRKQQPEAKVRDERISAARTAAVKLSRSTVLEVAVTGLDDEGYGIADGGSHSLRIAGGLPGDRVRVGIDHVAARIAFGHVKKILDPSPTRSRRPACPGHSRCLACPLVAMKYREQLEWKREHVIKQFRQYHNLGEFPVHPVLSPQRLSQYRTTARLVIAGKHSDPYIGIYRRSSHDVIDLRDCPLHHPLVNKVIEAVRRGISKLKVPIYNPRSRMGLLRYLVVRVSESEGKAMVVFVTAERSYNEIHHLSKFVQSQVPEVDVVAQNVNGSVGNVIMGQTDHFLTRKHHLVERVGDVALMISPRSFFQVNLDGARLIYGKVLEWAALSERETVLDLYCGIGGIALSLAPHAGRVLGIEMVDAAVADADKNAKFNRIENCSFEAGDAAEMIEELVSDGDKVDVAVLNPPRRGCDERVLRQVAALSPRTLIFVSCSPQTLARDISLLFSLGYVCREVQPVDMFPQTMHVENVARLEKR